MLAKPFDSENIAAGKPNNLEAIDEGPKAYNIMYAVMPDDNDLGGVSIGDE